MKNLEIYEKFRSVPNEAKKEIGAGRLKGFTDINPMWRIKQLTEQFGVCGFGWYTEITEQKIIDGSDNQKAAFVTINLFVKIDNEWSKPIQGVGGSSFVTNERNGAYTSDECFKMAYTDALSIACKSLGMGADVYYAKDRTKYDQEPKEPKQPAAPGNPLIEKYNKEKAILMQNIEKCSSPEELTIIKETYPDYLKIAEFKNALIKKFESLK